MTIYETLTEAVTFSIGDLPESVTLSATADAVVNISNTTERPDKVTINVGSYLTSDFEEGNGLYGVSATVRIGNGKDI